MQHTNDLTEHCVKSTQVYKGCMLNVFHDDVSLPNGNLAEREYLRHIGAVCVVPLTDEGKVILEHQYRYPVAEVVLELPAGKRNSKEEPDIEAAKRELREETGITADRWDDLGLYVPAPAYCDETIGLFLARGLHFGEQELDEDEFLNVEAIPLETIKEGILNGTITDGKTQTAILKACFFLERENS